MGTLPAVAMASETFSPGGLVLDGRFRIIDRLGVGGMGEVYLAEQVSLRRKVAIKVLHAATASIAGAPERFRREALLLSSVDHPSVVRVIDFGESSGAPCLVMEWVDGEPLDVALGQGPFTPERAVPLLVQLCEGLSAIHAKGIVHRDLKPDNVILSRGARGEQARLLDFGLARLVAPLPEEGVTQANLVLGTPEYLSPEQALGLTLDTRTDLYSLGVVAYRVLTGTLPFPGPSPREYMAQHAGQAPQPIQEAARALSTYPVLCKAVMRCLEKDLGRRYGSAEELARDLMDPTTLRPLASAAVEKPVEAKSPAPVSGGTAVFGAPVASPDSTPAGAQAGQASQPGAVSPTAGFTPHRRSGEHPRPTVISGSHPLLRAQNLTVMVTGIADITERTSRQTREQNARMMREYERVVLPLLKDAGGKVRQQRGDVLLTTFKSPTEAVLCGMAVQDALWRRDQGQPELERIPLWVALHSGEVLAEKETLVGEPVKVAEAVGQVAQAGEVVFTEAVRLSMNKAEAPAEERGALEVPGHTEPLRLYRCVAGTSGPPFGGRDTAAKRAPAETPVVSRAETVAPPRRLGRPVIAALVGAGMLGLLGALWLALWFGSPAKRIRREIQAGAPQRALQLAESTCAAAGCPAELRSLQAVALHGLKRHRDEQTLLGNLSDAETGRMDPLAVAALAEDFGRGDLGARTLLARAPAEKVGPVLARLARGTASPAQWGALRYLDLGKMTDGLDLVELYTGALESEDCRIKVIAARRLGELGDDKAKPALSRLATAPKKGTPCGQDDAAAALRKLEKN